MVVEWGAPKVNDAAKLWSFGEQGEKRRSEGLYYLAARFMNHRSPNISCSVYYMFDH